MEGLGLGEARRVKEPLGRFWVIDRSYLCEWYNYFGSHALS